MLNPAQEQRQNIYKMHKAQTDVSIIEQSDANLKALQERVSKNYNDETLLTRLQQVWYTFIVPEITLKHITRDIKVIKEEGCLSSVNYRSRAGQSINNRHTRGSSSRGEYIYFTLGLPEHRLQYWDADEKPHTINVAIGKAFCEGKADLCPGLWIGSHVSPQVASGHLPSKYFGSTLRSVSYVYDDNENGKKLTHYRDLNEKEHVSEENRNTEIFSAEHGLKNIFDALFYQVLDEIYHIAGEFKNELVNSENPEKLLRAAFKHLFIPDVYPEAKLPAEIFNINHPYVSIVTEEYNSRMMQSLFDVIKRRDLALIKAILEKHPEYLETKINSKTPLYTAVEVFTSDCRVIEKDAKTLAAKVIDYLLQQGANFNATDGFNPLISKLLEDKSEESLQILEKILYGIPDQECRLIRHSVHRQQMLDNSYDLLSKALQCQNQSAFELLLQHGAAIKSHNAILRSLYTANKKDNFQTFLNIVQRFTIDINATDISGNTLLMYAASNEQFIQWWLNTFPATKLNLQNNSGRTALHLAVVAEAVAVVKLLLERGVDYLLLDKDGESAYSLAVTCAKKVSLTTPMPLLEVAPGFSERMAEIEKTKEERRKHNYQSILNILEDNNAVVVYPKSIEQTARVKRFTVAALVLRVSENKKEILFIRKKSNNGSPIGHFLFPGGFKDVGDKDDMQACARECLEETGITINPKSFYPFSWFNKDELHCCHFGYAEVPHALDPIAMDDVAEALWIDWSEVGKNEAGYSYEDIAIDPSNALIIEAYLENDLETKKKSIDECLQLKIVMPTMLQHFVLQNERDAFEKLVRTQQFDISQQAFIAMAVFYNRFDWIPTLIALGADINSIFTVKMIRCTALFVAVARGNFVLAEDLMTQGADINLPIPNMMSGELETLLIFLCKLPETKESCDFLKLLVETHRAKLSEDIGTKALIAALKTRNFKMATYLMVVDCFNYIDVNQPCLIGSQKCNAISMAMSIGAVDFFKILHKSNITPELCLDFDGLGLIENALSRYFMCWDNNMPFNSDTNVSILFDMIETRAMLFSFWPHLIPKDSLSKLNVLLRCEHTPTFFPKFLESLEIEKAHFLLCCVQDQQQLILFVQESEHAEWQLPFFDKAPLPGTQICYKFMLALNEIDSLVQYRTVTVDVSKQQAVVADILTSKPNVKLCLIPLEQVLSNDKGFNSADACMIKRYFSQTLKQRFDPELDCLIFQKAFVEKRVEPEKTASPAYLSWF